MPKRTARFLALGLALFSVLAWLADRDGYEGDDLAQIEGALHLTEKGFHGVYRFYWQPLTYQVSHWMTTLGAPPSALFWLPQIAITIGVLGMIWRMRDWRWPLTLSFFLLIPELMVTGLYFNSTALGFAFASWALVLDGAWSGILMAIALLCRLDFLLIAPLWLLTRERRVPALVGALPVMLFLVDGAPNVLNEWREAGGDFARWSLRQAVQVALGSANWFVWLAVAAAVVLAIRERRRAAFWIAWVVPIYPIFHLMSGKYLVPFFLVLPLGLESVVAALKQRRLVYAVLAFALVVQVVPRHSQWIWTADGDRFPKGGYLHTYWAVTHPPEQSQFITFAQALASYVNTSRRSGELILPENNWLSSSWRWGWVGLYLTMDGFRVTRYESDRVMTVVRGDQTFTIRTGRSDGTIILSPRIHVEVPALADRNFDGMDLFLQQMVRAF